VTTIDPELLAHDGIVPDEVRRLHLHPGDTLIVRVSNLAPQQMREYRDVLAEWFPDNPVRVVLGEEILVAEPGEGDDAGR
jgi:hypothetical protein